MSNRGQIGVKSCLLRVDRINDLNRVRTQFCLAPYLAAGEGGLHLVSRVEYQCWGRSYFLAFLSARFSFMVLAGFFFVSFFESWLFPMDMLLINVLLRVSR